MSMDCLVGWPWCSTMAAQEETPFSGVVRERAVIRPALLPYLCMLCYLILCFEENTRTQGRGREEGWKGERGEGRG